MNRAILLPTVFAAATGSTDQCSMSGAERRQHRMVLRNLMLAATLVAAFLPTLAEADCFDPPGPGADWSRCNFDGLNLRDTDLSGARLRDASFFRSDLTGSNLSNVEAYRAKFVSADLKGVVLDGAALSSADLTKANLTNASLVGADLRLARLYRTNLRGADLTGAQLEGADLTSADLSGATWVNGSHVCAEGSTGRCL